MNQKPLALSSASRKFTSYYLLLQSHQLSGRPLGQNLRGSIPALSFMSLTFGHGKWKYAHILHSDKPTGSYQWQFPHHIQACTPTTSGTSSIQDPHAFNSPLEEVKLLPNTAAACPCLLLSLHHLKPEATMAYVHQPPVHILPNSGGHKASSQSGPVEANTPWA